MPPKTALVGLQQIADEHRAQLWDVRAWVESGCPVHLSDEGFWRLDPREVRAWLADNPHAPRSPAPLPRTVEQLLPRVQPTRSPTPVRAQEEEHRPRLPPLRLEAADAAARELARAELERRRATAGVSSEAVQAMREGMHEGMKASEVAAELEVAVEEIRAWQALGCPYAATPRGARFELAAVRRWLASRTNDARADTAQEEPAPVQPEPSVVAPEHALPAALTPPQPAPVDAIEAPVSAPVEQLQVAADTPPITPQPSLTDSPTMALLTAAEIAALHGIEPKTIYNWKHAGAPSERTPEGLRFDPDAISAWLASRPSHAHGGDRLAAARAAKAAKRAAADGTEAPVKAPRKRREPAAETIPQPAPARATEPSAACDRVSPDVLAWVTAYVALRRDQLASIDVAMDDSGIHVRTVHGDLHVVDVEDLTPAGRALLLPPAAA